MFINIRDDELEHVVTMTACQSPSKIARDIANKKRPASAPADEQQGSGAYIPRAYLKPRAAEKK